jgi:hypothetical protein
MSSQVLPYQIALEAAAVSRLTSHRTHETLVSRLESNDAALMQLKLVKKPTRHFGDDFASFLLALVRNHTVTSVELSWRFLSALSAGDRVLLMDRLGSLSSLEKIMMEAIGPCEALVAALEKTQNLKTLWIGALRLSSNADIIKLTQALRRNTTLQQIHLYNIRLQVQGSYRVDRGMVWFQENESSQQTVHKLDLNPLLTAIAEIPPMQKIQLDLKINPDRMERIRKETLRQMCRPDRTFLMLRSCDLDDDDCATLAGELKNGNSKIETLNLSRNNRISEFGWTILAQALETNYTLTGLFTPTTSEPMEVNNVLAGQYSQYVASRNTSLMEPSECTPPSPETRAKMDLLLKLNEKGRKNLLCDPTVTKLNWLEFLVREIDEIDMVFYVLQSVPSLFFI